MVVFNHINNSMAIDIARKELNLFKEKLETKNILLEFSETCVEYIAKKGMSQEFGAREIIRIINSQFKPLLIEEILFGKLSSGGKCRMDVIDGEVKLTFI